MLFRKTWTLQIELSIVSTLEVTQKLPPLDPNNNIWSLSLSPKQPPRATQT